MFKQEIKLFIEEATNDNDLFLDNLIKMLSEYNEYSEKYPDKSEVDILWIMRRERRKILNNLQYWNRNLEADTINEEIKFIEQYLPKEPNEEDVIAYLNTLPKLDKNQKNFRFFLTSCEKYFNTRIPPRYIIHYYYL